MTNAFDGPVPGLPLSSSEVPMVQPSVFTIPTLDEASLNVAPVSVPGAREMGVRVESLAEYRGPQLNIHEMLMYLVHNDGSDLHITVGVPPSIRLHGDISAIPNTPVLTPPMIQQALYSILTPPQIKTFEEKLELNFAYTFQGVSRFRVNLFRQQSSIGAVFRVVPAEIKPLESLGLPTVLYSFAALQRGLVLVTGPTGSGKSTTLAALVDKANRTRAGHIMTIEDPIEFVHQHRGCVVNQREVGSDTYSFDEALRNVLRQDPDIILIGELRDLETISIALTAAETGHLVFATLHTQSAQETINRIIDVFPSTQQGQIRSQLAGTLKGVICQTLVKKAETAGRVPAAEVMIVDAGIANMIRQDAVHQIPQALQSSGQKGNQTLNMHLADMVAKGVIRRTAAEEYATDLADLDALITGGRSRYGTAAPSILPSTGSMDGSSI